MKEWGGTPKMEGIRVVLLSLAAISFKNRSFSVKIWDGVYASG